MQYQESIGLSEFKLNVWAFEDFKILDTLLLLLLLYNNNKSSLSSKAKKTLQIQILGADGFLQIFPGFSFRFIFFMLKPSYVKHASNVSKYVQYLFLISF